VTYVNLAIDRFSETGAGVAGLNIDNQSADSLRTRVGGTARYAGKVGSIVVTPHLSAFWQHEFLNETANITSQFEGLPAGTGTFTVVTPRGDGDTALLDFGVDVDIIDNVTLFLDYDAEAGGSSFFGQSATGGVKLAF
jgi:subtilase-type serine protease